MRIAQVAPLLESVPPRLYGGTERVVSFLTEELVRQGHDVTLYASGDSITEANIKPICERGLRLSSNSEQYLAYYTLLIQQVFNEAHLYDIIHFHIDFLHFPLGRLFRTPQVTTLHGRQDYACLKRLYREFFEVPVVSISHAQRLPLPDANWQATVYNGIPEHLFSFHPEPQNYFAFLGRAAPEKGMEEAIRIAQAAGMELRIAAKVDSYNEEYFEKTIRPLLRDPLIHFIGEINEQEKNDFLGNARAVLFPINWPEPFGMVMIEAMACGTPVIAYRRGSVPEIMQDGITGYIVGSLDEAVEAVHRIDSINRSRCRELYLRRFSSARMAQKYINVYRKLLNRVEDEEGLSTGNGEVNYGRRYSDQRQMVYSGDVIKGG